MTHPSIAAYSVKCMDPRDTDITYGVVNKQEHVLEQLIRGEIDHQAAEYVRQQIYAGNITSTRRSIAIHLGACAGGGWSREARRDIETQFSNKLDPIAFYSVRHKNCASIGSGTHYTDPDAAVMIVIDRDELNLNHVPVFRAHYEIILKEEVFEASPMPLESLVAYAKVFGNGDYFPDDDYSVDEALEILNLSQLNPIELEELASRIELSQKGLIIPGVPLQMIATH